MTKIVHQFLYLLTALPAIASFSQNSSDLKPDMAVRWGRCDNGIRYAVMKNVEPKGRISLRFAVTAGSLNEAEDQRGLAHFLEHLAFNGSTHFPSGTLVEYFQRNGMSFGGDTNAFTTFDRTEYQLELPDAKAETLEKALTLFADYGDGLFLTPASIEKERGIILSEERARDSVGIRSWKNEIGFILPDAIIARRLPIGLKEVITHAQRERIADYYHAWYRPENFVVVAVGDFDAASVEVQLVKALSHLEPHGPFQSKASLGTVKSPVGIAARLHSDPDAPAVTVAIETVAPYAYEQDTALRRLERLTRNLALSMLNRRWALLAKKEGAPFSECKSAVVEQFDFYRNASVELICQPAEWREAIGVAEKELRRALMHGFRSAELHEAVSEVRNYLEQAVRTAATRQSPRLADDLVESVIDRKVFTAPEDNLKLLAPVLDKVSVEDCVRVLRDAWSESKGINLFVSGNLGLAEPEKELVAAYRASQIVAVSAPENIAEATFAYTTFGPEGKVAVRQNVRDLGATLLEFENGVRLNVKATNFEAGRIRVSVRIGGGQLTEPNNQPGLAQAAAGTFISGGLGKHSIDDLQRMFADKTVDFSFGAGEDAFVLNGTTNLEDLALELQILCAFITDPGYRPEAFRQFGRATEQAYANFAHTVEGAFTVEVPALMASGDPRFGLPDKKVMLGYTGKEVEAWLAPQFEKGAIEIALVGDLDVEATIVAVARTFGALPLRMPRMDYTDERKVSIPAQPLKRVLTVPTEIDRGLVQLMWPATDSRDVHRARRLNLLAQVFQDRLRLKLREKMGDTYSPGTTIRLSYAFPGYGFIVAQAAVAPAHAQEVADAIKMIAANIVNEGVGEDELQRAKQPLLTALRTSERQNQYWLGNVLSAAQEQPQRLEWARNRYADNESVTKADLEALAEQYLLPERASQFLSLPQAKRK